MIPVSQNDQIQEWLQAGIAAARRGEKVRARSYFEAILRADENNELAWIWMASVVPGKPEQRACLERVLRINPDNQRARDALNALVGVGGEAYDVERVQTAAAANRGGGGGLNALTGILVGIAALVVLALVSTLLNPPPATTVISTQRPSDTPVLFTNTPRPTATFPGVAVNPDERTLPTLPPTFTPTATETPTPTLPPTSTPVPVSAFEVMVVVRPVTQTQGEALLVPADGSAQAQIYSTNVREADFNATGEQIVFVRDVAYGVDGASPAPEATDDPDSIAVGNDDAIVSEIFIAPANDPNNATQITNLQVADAYQPALSPDGRLLVFVSEYQGNDEELYLLDLQSNIVTPLTDNDFVDREPHWSPDGTKLVFTSDRESPGFTELFIYDFSIVNEDGSEPVTRLTNDASNSYMGRWSPNGENIAYINDRTGDGDLYVTTSAGTRTLLIAGDDSADDRHPTWSPDGRYIGFISNRQDERFQAYVTDIDGDEVVRILNDERTAESLTFRPDGRFMRP
jgi:Tol biopolymer transport system component